MEALGPKPDPNTATVLFFLACNEDAATQATLRGGMKWGTGEINYARVFCDIHETGCP
jgi:hypothetical protein